jgi:dephospho-CoA kinase
MEAQAGPDAVVVHDIPLLAETGQASTFDAVVVVDVPVETQVERMVTRRGMSREEAEARIAAQASREERLAIATHVIENTGTLEDLRERVTEVFESLVAKGGS